MARQPPFNNPSSTLTKSHKRVLSTSSTTSVQPPPKRLSPSPSPPPLYIVTEIFTPRSQSPLPQPQETIHGIFTDLSEANSVVSKIRLGYGVFCREALMGYRAEIVDGALSWGVPWGGREWDGVEVGVRRVDGVGREEEVGRMGMEGFSLVIRERGVEGEDWVMGG